jgi:hypothetical protein
MALDTLNEVDNYYSVRAEKIKYEMEDLGDELRYAHGNRARNSIWSKLITLRVTLELLDIEWDSTRDFVSQRRL